MRDNPARVLLPAVVALALVGVVAIAAAGSTPGGSREVRMPSDGLMNAFYSVMLVLLVAGAALLAYGLSQRKAIADMAKGRRRLGFLPFVAVIVAFTGLMSWLMHSYEPREAVVEIGDPTFNRELPQTTLPDPEGGAGAREAYEPEFVWAPVLALLALIAGAVALWYVRERRESRRHGDAEVEEAIAAVLDTTLDDLRAEKDPRKAVIAAYARLERTLGAHALGRRPEETPQEYLHRILPRLELERGSVRRLTDLFTWAKFSPHAVDVRMKDEAIQALSTVRDELRAAAERRRTAELARLEEART